MVQMKDAHRIVFCTEDENSRGTKGGGQARVGDNTGLRRWTEKMDERAGSATGR